MVKMVALYASSTDSMVLDIILREEIACSGVERQNCDATAHAPNSNVERYHFPIFSFSQHDPPGRIYEHSETGAMILLSAFRDSDKVYEHHLAAARLELENFGLADPTVFAAQLHKAG